MATVNSFLLVNLGCEMIYIIDQRLIAQNIDKEKSSKGWSFKNKNKIFYLQEFIFNCF